MPDPAPVLLKLVDVAKHFDVSPPWLNRILERQERRILHAVDGVSFEINKSETLALVGESGCGKSTVARLIVGLYRPTRGNIYYAGPSIPTAAKMITGVYHPSKVTPDLVELSQASAAGSAARAVRQKLQMIFQDPYASLNPRWRVADIIAEPILNLKRKNIRARINELLGQVGLAAQDGEKYPHQFSGGQRQRISIARALASNPEFLVCDEPTSALDVSVQAQVLNLMKELQRKMGLTYLFISHNLAVVHHIADRVGVMYLGKIVELADKKTLFRQPQHPYTRMLLDAIPDLDMTGKARTPVAGEVPNPLNPPSGCTFHPRCPYANARCKQESPQLKSAPNNQQVACHAVEEHRLPEEGMARNLVGT